MIAKQQTIFIHSKQNQLQSDVRRVCSRDKIDQAPLLLTFLCVRWEPGDKATPRVKTRMQLSRFECGQGDMWPSG